MRHKLTRWNLSGFPRHNARRALSNLRRLQGLVPPRVHSAVLGSLFNRWVTAKRFQQASRPCRLGCAGDDKIEHYLRCRILHSFAARRLDLHILPEHRWPALLLVHEHSDLQLTRIAVFHYVAYRAVNIIRHKRPRLDVDSDAERDRLLQQLVVEAVRGHASARRISRAHCTVRTRT